MKDVPASAAGGQIIEGLGKVRIVVQGILKFGRIDRIELLCEIHLAAISFQLDGHCHELADQAFLSCYRADILKPELAHGLGMRAWRGEHACSVLKQRSFEEAKGKIVLCRMDDGDVVALVRIAELSPFDFRLQAAVEEDRVQRPAFTIPAFPVQKLCDSGLDVCYGHLTGKGRAFVRASRSLLAIPGGRHGNSSVDPA